LAYGAEKVHCRLMIELSCRLLFQRKHFVVYTGDRIDCRAEETNNGPSGGMK